MVNALASNPIKFNFLFYETGNGLVGGGNIMGKALKGSQLGFQHAVLATMLSWPACLL